MLEIVNERPPVWDQAHRVFEIDDSRTVYTYGDKLYNPAGCYLDPEIIAHEEVHYVQQGKTEGGPKAWWDKYLVDAEFRFIQEAEAYGKQYQFYCQRNGDRNKRARYLFLLSEILASPMYKLGISAGTASREIQYYADKFY